MGKARYKICHWPEYNPAARKGPGISLLLALLAQAEGAV